VLAIRDSIPGVSLADAEIIHSSSPSNRDENGTNPALFRNFGGEAFCTIDE